MFDNLKDLYNLKKQAAEMENQLKGESVTGFSDDKSLSVTLNGKHDLLEVKLADGVTLEKSAVERAFKQAYADAQGKLQKILMEKFKDMM